MRCSLDNLLKAFQVGKNLFCIVDELDWSRWKGQLINKSCLNVPLYKLADKYGFKWTSKKDETILNYINLSLKQISRLQKSGQKKLNIILLCFASAAIDPNCKNEEKKIDTELEGNFASGAQSTHEVVQFLLKTSLTEREVDFIKRRFAIGYIKPATLQEIGDNEGISRERVRQIIQKAINKIRQNKNTYLILKNMQKRDQGHTPNTKFNE